MFLSVAEDEEEYPNMISDVLKTQIFLKYKTRNPLILS